jgi:UDP-2-acetamido-2,6-beta-L-arabino-hexul-4-ose reductase
MRVLVTGSEGFVAKNLIVRLQESGRFEVSTFNRSNHPSELESMVAVADQIVHLAGENRPVDEADFMLVNAGLTQSLCDAIASTGRNIPLILASSIQAERDNTYGRSKKAGEDFAAALANNTGNTVRIYRLPNIFGKWCRPNYNSAVATFCHNVATGQPIRIDNPDTELRLVYVDDVVDCFIAALDAPGTGLSWPDVKPEYRTTVGELARQIRGFASDRQDLMIDRVGTGFIRALYATYISYLPANAFAYEIPCHSDPRGDFVEMLKTRDSGQFSFFTAHPGVTRGGHYHHSKTEKFLVIKGEARFGFRNILTEEYVSLTTSGEKPMVVETIPGWSHDITNIGDSEMVVMLWANEIFDRDRPDTIARSV